MYTSNTFQAEIDYRTNRIRKGVAVRPRRRVRNPLVRRPADTSDNAS
jgi:hypothetical protein